ncbi:MAG: hypothetical protein MR685_00190 [Alistipes sp.]|nr:hypothetical protein [Alistipes sp.]MDY3834549.1 hypothetical protein [Candidatus Cryptobacteroides sp.]MEE0430858.1 hypothetical protein [Bacteroidales bacterium]MEE1407306.1 hypothetical protein [Bacteroidales bacterium]
MKQKAVALSLKAIRAVSSRLIQTKPSSMRFKEFRPCSPIFRHTAMM